MACFSPPARAAPPRLPPWMIEQTEDEMSVKPKDIIELLGKTIKSIKFAENTYAYIVIKFTDASTITVRASELHDNDGFVFDFTRLVEMETDSEI